MEVDRAQVLAYRVAAHEFDRAVADPADLAVLSIGVQDSPYGSAQQALAARLPKPADPATPPALEGLPLTWSVRGAPHLHRWADLPRLARALWPLTDADATARINSSQIAEGARLGIAAFTATAEAMRAAVTAPMPKGEVSTAVSAAVPKSLTFWCEPCGAQHISGAIFQLVGLAAGVRVEPVGRATTLVPLPDQPPVPTVAEGTDRLVADYLRLLGPATRADAARYLGTTPTLIRAAWPGDLAEVTVDGRAAWIPEDRLTALRAAPKPRLARLLPPSDPFMQARDRELLVPDKQRRAAVWRPLGSPGAVLVDGEIAGIWRAKQAGKGKCAVTVTPFAKLPARIAKELSAEAERLAEARGATEARLVIDEG